MSSRAVRPGPALVVAAGATIVLAGVGIISSRPDIVAMGLPVAIWIAMVHGRANVDAATAVEVTSRPASVDAIETVIDVDSAADAVELAIVQSQRRTRTIVVPGRRGRVVARSRILHSGPITAVRIAARGILAEGALLGPATPVLEDIRHIEPDLIALDTLPLPRSLTGLHGAHQGRRPGHGGDFRDIHPFAPGDELRRVDWRATARMARRPGDLLVRRTQTVSDASVVIAIDTAEDLGTVVASWGSGDGERSGVTSLDRARQAARSIASSAIGVGDRVALHVLVHGGRSVRSGSGSRHLARLEATIAAIAQADDDATFRRTPPVPPGSVVYVVSTFFQGAAADTALMWRGGGHRVVAVDILPELDRSRLTPAQRIALRVVMAERENVLSDLRGAGIDVMTWSDAASGDLRVAARTRR